MNYAIIAAGEGSRLAQEGIREPKPLVKVCHEHLIDRLIRIFMANEANRISVICNALTSEVCRHLQAIKTGGMAGSPVPLDFIVQTTPSSMHSFYELSKVMEPGPFVMTTVDTIFIEDEFADYVRAFKAQLAAGFDGLMGVTDFIDDEQPLYVGTDEAMNVTGFYDDDPGNRCRFISGGIYGLTSSAFDTLRNCMERGESRMRNFQRGLVSDGRKLKAYRFSKVMDVDHATDIRKAEAFIQ